MEETAAEMLADGTEEVETTPLAVTLAEVSLFCKRKKLAATIGPKLVC